MEAGADVVGGCPHLGPGATDSVAHAFEVAARAGLPVDLHTDETLDPSMLTVLDMADHVRSAGFDHGVAASHCVSLGMQSPADQHRIAGQIADAGIAVLPQPQTNLYLQGRGHPTATPRGLTALRALREAGVVVAAGADNVQDPYNLVGRFDPLETAALLVMAGHVPPDEAYAMVSTDGRRALGLPPAELEPGDPADFVAVDAPSVRGAIADAPAARRVFRAGRLVASAAGRGPGHPVVGIGGRLPPSQLVATVARHPSPRMPPVRRGPVTGAAGVRAGECWWRQLPARPHTCSAMRRTLDLK